MIREEDAGEKEKNEKKRFAIMSWNISAKTTGLLLLFYKRSAASKFEDLLSLSLLELLAIIYARFLARSFEIRFDRPQHRRKYKRRNKKKRNHKKRRSCGMKNKKKSRRRRRRR